MDPRSLDPTSFSSLLPAQEAFLEKILAQKRQLEGHIARLNDQVAGCAFFTCFFSSFFLYLTPLQSVRDDDVLRALLEGTIAELREVGSFFSFSFFEV